MPEGSAVLFVVIGLAAGLLSGVFGIGGGVVIVPALIYWAGFSQHRATGTSLAVLLPPPAFHVERATAPDKPVANDAPNSSSMTGGSIHDETRQYSAARTGDL